MRFLSLEDAIEQFSKNMLSQLSFLHEANHLNQFRNNFRDSQHIVFPEPFTQLTTESVLVESFEPGDSISKYLNSPHPWNKYIAKEGLQAYLKMMLIDYFVHADLHPGNILVRPTPNENYPTLVILDVGLVTAFSSVDAQHFVELFKAIVEGNGAYGAELMAKHSKEPTKFDKPQDEGRCSLFIFHYTHFSF